MTRLPVYLPNITHAPVYFPRNGSAPYLRYNHCADTIRFRGRFLTVWNANRNGREGVAGQYNFLSTSEDFIHWTSPLKLFSGDYCDPPIHSDLQWQPSLLNDRDETLFCAWCDTGSGETFIASTTDGIHWKNRRIPQPPLFSSAEGIVAFPTNHGLAAQDGSLYFPVSFRVPDYESTRYAGVLISRDRGKSWYWSKPVEAVTWETLGIMPEPGLMERPSLWEPIVYEYDKDTLGLLVRNNTNTRNHPAIQPEHLLLFSQSPDGGESWTPCCPVELETVVSRCYAERTASSFLMVMNDWIRGIPGHIPQDRLHLSLFCGTSRNPDLLLPGPVVQPQGGRAFYPNGFTFDGKLYLVYTYPDCIGATIVHDLPDGTHPYLLPRGGRDGLRINSDTVELLQPQATLGLVLPESFLEKELITLEFAFSAEVRSEADFPLLSLGGKTKCGARLLLRFDADSNRDILILADNSGSEIPAGSVPFRSSVRLRLNLFRDRIELFHGTQTICLKGSVLRKIAFGGLYEPPVYPLLSCAVRDKIRIPIDSIHPE